MQFLCGFSLADSVERAFQKGPFQLSSSQDIKCEALAVWWKNVQQCLSDDVFVAPLSDSFVRLLLQLVSRLSTWVVTGIENTESEANGKAATDWSPRSFAAYLVFMLRLFIEKAERGSLRFV